jgi:hypothetical protein
MGTSIKIGVDETSVSSDIHTFQWLPHIVYNHRPGYDYMSTSSDDVDHRFKMVVTKSEVEITFSTVSDCDAIPEAPSTY